ncbi:MAG: hypothetical protein A2V81_05015 [Candidatus Abawacabacteria bacterium RBG_16_42_10]|uniref:Amine oxidase domain-containing protein n=1 Tax=Candidatus Abawacabacteria bacterium RBG_16_42_10 TaxID=1817814 RepID=A0A1F4XIZ7_9BACT|nr:MAG: hypothetical protein A2V81_05015 [Candidatus Abawacabacteria bacterium RBG_16_42_10]
MTENFSDIIIVGAGMAGLGCAARLHENGFQFKIITENIGGRVKTSPDGEVNYGAYYITEDCKNILPFVEITGNVKFSNSRLHKGNDHYRLFSLRAIKHGFAFLRLLKDLQVFRKHINKNRELGTEHARDELIENDALIKQYYHEQASEYIKRRGLEKIVDEFLEQFLWASFFYDCRKVSTALFLGSLLPLLAKGHSFKMLFKKFTENFQKDIIFDSVVKVQRMNDHFELTTKSGKIYSCKKLVLATPMTITNKLVKPQKINGGINVSYYHVRGKIKPLYAGKGYNFFALAEASAISREPDGSNLYFYAGKDKIAKYFDQWEVITHDTWEPCLYFLGDNYVNMNPEPNLFLANDHNVPGLEDAFINGQYTAKLVMNKNKLK